MRNFWVNVHLVLGLTLGLLGVFIGVSGSLLIYDAEIDARLNPQRYAVSADRVALPLQQYLDNAVKAAGEQARAANLRLPIASGQPVIAFVRSGGSAGGLLRVYMDPPTGRVLDASQGGAMAWLHTFHENLNAREYWGREVVGAVGIGMLISSLSGLYLWWPGRNRLRHSLGVRPGFTTTRNLHYLFGFYCAVVLAMLSFTGIFIAYTDAGRTAVGWFSPLTPRQAPATSGEAKGAAVSVDAAVAAARASYPAARVTLVGLPVGRATPYRITLAGPGDMASVPVAGITVFVDPASGQVLQRIDDSTRTAGDRFLVAQRTMHEGEAFGEMGKAILFLVGFLPLLFVVTGTLLWRRSRRPGGLGGDAAP